MERISKKIKNVFLIKISIKFFQLLIFIIFKVEFKRLYIPKKSPQGWKSDEHQKPLRIENKMMRINFENKLLKPTFCLYKIRQNLLPQQKFKKFYHIWLSMLKYLKRCNDIEKVVIHDACTNIQ